MDCGCGRDDSVRCQCGRVMVPVAEYHPSEDGTDYVVFRCLGCEADDKRDWDSYWRYRPQSFDCVKCGKRIWGSTAKKCSSCGSEIPRVVRYVWHVPVQGDEDRPKYAESPGSLYAPEEWAELEGRKAV